MKPERDRQDDNRIRKAGYHRPRNPIVWIDRDPELVRRLRPLAAEKELGLDVETTLDDPPQLCLVQIADRERNYIIDPLAGVDLAPLFRLLRDERIVKVVHYAPFEKGVFSALGVKLRNVFDTFEYSRRLWGKLSRYDHSLAVVCQRELGLKINKMPQKSDWRRRPLTPAQIEYAAFDAELMLVLYDHFRERFGGGLGLS